MMRLPFEEVDVLIIDRMGKNISGSGMDTNVIGRAKPSRYKVKRIFIRDLTPETHGNAVGLCYADITTPKLIDQINFHDTNMNAITSGFTEAGAIPLRVPTEREAVEVALDTIGLTPAEQARVIWIPDTLHLKEMYVSESLLAELPRRPDLEQIGPLQSFDFDARGELLPLN
jgi:hypothetical protein